MLVSQSTSQGPGFKTAMTTGHATKVRMATSITDRLAPFINTSRGWFHLSGRIDEVGSFWISGRFLRESREVPTILVCEKEKH
jgi:hypothetical protein